MDVHLPNGENGERFLDVLSSRSSEGKKADEWTTGLWKCTASLQGETLRVILVLVSKQEWHRKVTELGEVLSSCLPTSGVIFIEKPSFEPKREVLHSHALPTRYTSSPQLLPPNGCFYLGILESFGLRQGWVLVHWLTYVLIQSAFCLSGDLAFIDPLSHCLLNSSP